MAHRKTEAHSRNWGDTDLKSVPVLAYTHELDVKEQDRIWRNVWRKTPLTVTKRWGNNEFTFAPDFHGGQTFIPSFDDGTGTEAEFVRLATINGAVKLGSVFERASVMDKYGLSFLWHRSRAFYYVDVFQSGGSGNLCAGRTTVHNQIGYRGASERKDYKNRDDPEVLIALTRRRRIGGRVQTLRSFFRLTRLSMSALRQSLLSPTMEFGVQSYTCFYKPIQSQGQLHVATNLRGEDSFRRAVLLVPILVRHIRSAYDILHDRPLDPSSSQQRYDPIVKGT